MELLKKAIFNKTGWTYDIELGTVDDHGEFIVNGYNSIYEDRLEAAIKAYEKQGYLIKIIK